MIGSVRKRSCRVLPCSADGRFYSCFREFVHEMYMKERRHFNFTPVKIEYGRIFIEQKNDTHRPDGSLQKLNQNNRCMFETISRRLFNIITIS